MFKKLIQKKLENYVKAYFKSHPQIKLVIVAGSVGKTSTKMAIATVLSERFRVRVHEGNHNAELSAPLAILGIEYPTSLKSISSWMAIFKAARARIRQQDDVDVVIQEVGSDRIGQVAHSSTYLQPHVAVITAVSPEHMEFFGNLENVAKEELTAANFSEVAIINRDDIPGEYAKFLTNPNINTYGSSAAAEYYVSEQDFNISDGISGQFIAKDWQEPVDIEVKLMGDHILRSVAAAGAVAIKLGLNSSEVAAGLSKIRPVKGRMNVLRGVKGSTIIDDSYNSSPLAVSSALTSLYRLSSPQKIAVLGSMNELGDTSAAEHMALGKLCDSSQLAWVVTVGEEANKYLAPAAKENGCQVRSFNNAIEAGSFVHGVIEEGSAVLFKGSQGGIYLEESIKVILHVTEEESQLVRQSADWTNVKNKFFSKY